VVGCWYAGTGSQDFIVKDVFVPAANTCFLGDPPAEAGPLYNPRLVLVFLFATVVANSLGIARGAIDAFIELAASDSYTASTVVLRDRPFCPGAAGYRSCDARRGSFSRYGVSCGGNKRNLLPQSIGAIFSGHPRCGSAQHCIPRALRVRRQGADGFAPQRYGLVTEPYGATNLTPSVRRAGMPLAGYRVCRLFGGFFFCHRGQFVALHCEADRLIPAAAAEIDLHVVGTEIL
jgi:hypothetical protein